MDGGNPYALAARKRDILLTLKSNEVYHPDSIPVSELRALLPNGENADVEDAVNELATKTESPLHYYPSEQQKVYLSGEKIDRILYFVSSLANGNQYWNVVPRLKPALGFGR